MTQNIKKNKYKINEAIINIFIDGHEYVKTSFSKTYILAVVHGVDPLVDFQKDIYPIFTRGRNKLEILFNENSRAAKYFDAKLIEPRNVYLNIFLQVSQELCKQKELPVYYDRKVREYRVVYDLPTFEQVFGDLSAITAKMLKKRLILMAKTGAELPSGKNSRELLYRTLKTLKKIEFQKEDSGVRN